MSKNDRFVVRHAEGWAVKKAGADHASSIHGRQADAERAAKQTVSDLGGGEVASRAVTGVGATQIR
jgi:hypothetical protein